MNNFYKLNLGNLINPNYKKILEKVDQGVTEIEVNKYIDPSLIKLLGKIGINPEKSLIFKLLPLESSHIHIDGYNKNYRIWVINYSWGSEDSTMIWYKSLNTSFIENFTEAGTPFITYKENEVTELERVGNLSIPTLVRTNIPHKVINFDKYNTRYCFSLRARARQNTWEEIVKVFSHYIIP